MADINSEKAIAERLDRLKAKQQRGDFSLRANVSAPARYVLVRRNGKPVFSTDPKAMPREAQEEYKKLMTPAEAKEIFG